MKPNEQNPLFTNPLINSSSPYLRQHAHNPVYWYPWGDEAIARARSEDKPILLSIGYSTCYWCHVMEREVFENPAIAALMNRTFINIKVDREEHPQLDEIYMTARQLMTHEGGWPNHVFLNHDLKPFHAGGTYGALDAYGKPAFPRLIEWLHDSWVNKRDEVESNATEAARVMETFLVQQAASATAEDFLPKIRDVRAVLTKNFDEKSGGFYKAPKFPQENFLQFLLAHFEFSGDTDSLDMAAFSLAKMASGGIYDHVGCGFHRYAVDKDWMVPHFEKMLYTQALLTRSYAETARITGNPFFADIARSVCEYIAGPFTDGGGAFYAALDAETDGMEGAYYAWTREEIESILTPEEAAFFVHHYGLAEIPHFHGHKHPEGEVIFARAPFPEMALAQNISYTELAGLAGQVLNKLLAVRNLRQSVARDEKIIIGWNGLMIDALAYAGKTLGNEDYIARARKAADYILANGLDNEGKLTRCIIAGQALHLSTLDDYAYFIKGLLSLHQASGDASLLATAKTLMERAEELFADEKNGGFFLTQLADEVIIRIKNGDDSALPNANAVMAENYLTLGQPDKALAVLQTFLVGENRIWQEYSSMLTVALKYEIAMLQKRIAANPAAPEKPVAVKLEMHPEGAKAGDVAEIHVKLHIKDGYHINATTVSENFLLPTMLSVQGKTIQALEFQSPEPMMKHFGEHEIACFEGDVTLIIQVMLREEFVNTDEIRVMIRYQPCNDNSCFAIVDDIIGF